MALEVCQTQNLSHEQFETRIEEFLNSVITNNDPISQPSASVPAQSTNFHNSTITTATTTTTAGSGATSSTASQSPPSSRDSTPSPSGTNSKSNKSGDSNNPSKSSSKKETPSSKPENNPSHLSSNTSHEEEAKRYQETLRKQKSKANEERKRILQLLESDKKERQARRALSQRTASSSNTPDEVFTENSDSDNASTDPPTHDKDRNRRFSFNDSKHCFLLIRMLDGTPLKHRFLASDNLAVVRKWVDENRPDAQDSNGSMPYNFFHPLSKKMFGEAEETQSTLAELDLVPSATVVLKSIKTSVTDAYGGGATGTGLNPYNIVQNGANAIINAVSTFLGIGYVPPRLKAEQDQLKAQERIQRDEQQGMYSRQQSRDGKTEEDDEQIDRDGSGSSRGNNEGYSDATGGVVHRHNYAAGGDRLQGATSSGLSTRYNSAVSFRDLISESNQQNHPNHIGIHSSASNSTSNIHTLNDTSDANQFVKKPFDDRITYNGNNLSLEDDSSRKRSAPSGKTTSKKGTIEDHSEDQDNK